MDGTLLNKKLKIEEKLAQLNEIAQKVDNMPTFTSNDRAFLEDLPGYPATDGKKVLTATTESGETALSYEEVESGENQIFSTTPVTIGKWIDNRDLKRVVLPFDATSGSASIDITSLRIDKAFCVGCFCQEEVYQTNNLAISPLYNSGDDKFSFQINGARSSLNVTAGNEKKGHGAIILCYVETVSTKRSKKS